MWACSRASTVAQFQKAMNYLKELDSAAYTHLFKLDPSYWSKHAFGYFVKSDAVCSNISECFNSYIKVAQDQPIITCLETIRRLLMRRFYEKRIGIEKYSGNICPRINQKLQENIRDSMHCNVIFGGGPAVEVEHTIHGIFMANIHLRSCSCRIWDFTGIPCSHACAAIIHIRGEPADYVHQSYVKSAFMKTYEFYIQPIPGPSEWPHQIGENVMPPIFRRQPGRPRRRRIREVGEARNPNRKRKGGILMTCSRCGSGGHNARRCKGDVADPVKAEQRKKDAARTARNRYKKKQATSEGSNAVIVSESLIRENDGKIKKAKVRRKKKVQEPIIIRESQVPTSQHPIRDWHSEYDNLGNAIPYERPMLYGPSQISSRGGTAMFTRGASLVTNTSNYPNVAEGSSSNVTLFETNIHDVL